MIDIIVVSALVIEVLALSTLEKRSFGTWITPFSALAYPYAGVVLLVSATARTLGFAPLYSKSVLVWIFGLLLVWLTGRFFSLATFAYTPVGKAAHIEPPTLCSEAVAHRVALNATCVLVPLLMCNLYLAQRSAGGWTRVDTPEFKAAYSSGFLGHMLMLSIPVLVLLVGTVRRSASLIVKCSLGLLVLFLFVGGVKGVILQPLVAGAMYRIFVGRLRISVRLGTIVAGCTVLVFSFVYLFGNAVADSSVLSDPVFYSFVLRHYFFYLFSGVLAFSEAFRLNVGSVGGQQLMVFAPFVNLYRSITKSAPLVNMGSSHAMGMNFDLTTSATSQASNVYTLFGTLYLYLDVFTSILYVLVMGLLLYGLLALVRRSANPWTLVVYCFLCAQLTFGFFELYFWLFNFIEISVYGLVLAWMCRSLYAYAQPKVRNNT